MIDAIATTGPSIKGSFSCSRDVDGSRALIKHDRSHSGCFAGHTVSMLDLPLVQEAQGSSAWAGDFTADRWGRADSRYVLNIRTSGNKLFHVR